MSSTIPVAVAALIIVAKTAIKAQIGDSAWGNLYTGLQFQDFMLFDSYDNPTVAMYEVSGTAAAQGLGTIKQYRQDTVRCDVMCSQAKDVRQIVEQVRLAWIADYNIVNGSGAVGQAYLRQTGGIKYLAFVGEPRNAPLEKRGYFRRQFDISIRIGD